MKTKLYTLVIFVVLLSMGFLLQACVYDINTIKGNGNIVTVEDDLSSFDELKISGTFKVTLAQGDVPHISIETDENIHEYITAEVRGNTLYLGMEKGSYDPSRLEVFITSYPLAKIDISGAASLVSETPLTGESLLINTSGASKIDIDLQSEDIRTRVSGAGKIDIRGKARKHDIKISGVASMNCRELDTEETRVSISGAGSAKVHVTGTLDASVSGVGSIKYSGDPENVRTNTSGAGSIKPA